MLISVFTKLFSEGGGGGNLSILLLSLNADKPNANSKALLSLIISDFNSSVLLVTSLSDKEEGGLGGRDKLSKSLVTALSDKEGGGGGNLSTLLLSLNEDKPNANSVDLSILADSNKLSSFFCNAFNSFSSFSFSIDNSCFSFSCISFFIFSFKSFSTFFFFSF